jgi:hypothetical protein
VGSSEKGSARPVVLIVGVERREKRPGVYDERHPDLRLVRVRFGDVLVTSALRIVVRSPGAELANAQWHGPALSIPERPLEGIANDLGN